MATFPKTTCPALPGAVGTWALARLPPPEAPSLHEDGLLHRDVFCPRAQGTAGPSHPADGPFRSGTRPVTQRAGEGSARDLRVCRAAVAPGQRGDPAVARASDPGTEEPRSQHPAGQTARLAAVGAWPGPGTRDYVDGRWPACQGASPSSGVTRKRSCTAWGGSVSGGRDTAGHVPVTGAAVGRGASIGTGCVNAARRLASSPASSSFPRSLCAPQPPGRAQTR